MSEEIILPEGYTRVDSIGSYGTQYIDLPVNTVEGDVVELVTVQRFIEISRQAEAKNGDPYFFFGINDNGNWYSGCGSGSSGMTKSEAADTAWHTFRMKYTPNSSDGGFWVDDVKYRDCDGTANVLPTYISLFKTYEGNYWTKCYKKSWKLYVNGELKYDLIPCLDNSGVPCMRDLVGGGTYYNQGTGTFGYIISPYPDNEDYESELPTGYKKCLYLQSDGTQYINTSIYKDISDNDATSTEAGIIPTDETGLYIKAQRLNYKAAIPFGCRSNGTTTIYPPRFDTSSKYMWYAWNGGIQTFQYDKGDDLIYSSSINFYNDRTVHFNSEDTDWDGYITEVLGETNQPLWLFSYNRDGGFVSPYSEWGGRIYRAKITQGTELIRDFVPCLDANGVPCMYDLVNGGSYYNQGSGSFEYCIDHKLPSDFIKLKYLEATGTQYINTNYIPQATDNGDGTYTATTGLYIDTYNITVSDSIPMGCRTTSNTDTRFFAHRLFSTSYNPGYGWGTYTTVSTIRGKVAYQSKLNFLNDKKSVLEAPIFSTITNALGNLSFQPTLPIYMFGINIGNTLNYNWKGRIYRAKISEGTEIVRDYVPAFDQRLARPCMYDIINNVAYYNDGTGEFLYNRDFEGDYVGFTQMGTIGNRVGGYYLELPLGYIDALFLENTGSQYIDSKLQTYSDSVISLTAQQVYAAETQVAGFLWFYGSVFNPDMNIGFSVTEWRYSSILGYVVVGNKGGNMPVFADKRYDILNITNTATHFIINGETAIPNFAQTHAPVPDSKLTYLIFAYINSSAKIGINRGCRIFSFNDTTPSQGGNRLDLVAAIDSNGVPCMYDKITQKTFYNASTSEKDFIVGLTKNQARKLYKLPPTTNRTLTISLPASIVDTDGITITDTIVKSAKEKAEENGWAFTIQTYTE